MGIKISFLIASIFLQAVVSELALDSNLKQNIYKKIVYKHGKNECVCFEQRPELRKVPKIIDPHNNGIERLIVIIYRTRNGKIYTYTPDISKQIILPDMQYEKGDSIKIDTNERLATMFINSNKKIHYRHVNEKYESIEVPDDSKDITKIIRCNSKQIQDSQEPCKDDYTPRDKKIMTQPIYVQPEQKIPEYYPPPTDNQAYTSTTENEQYPANPIIIKEEPLIINQNSPHSEQSTTKHNKGQIHNKNPSQNLLTNSNAYVPQGPVSNLTFSKWFNNQMNNMENQQALRSKPVSFGTIEHLIHTALKEHNMFISPNGVLTDSKGHTLNMSNVNIRPILIGDSLEYNKVIRNPNGTFAINENAVYLESLLIGFLSPSKIIAIIPLAKINLPKSFEHMTKSKINSRKKFTNDGVAFAKRVPVKGNTATVTKDDENIKNKKPNKLIAIKQLPSNVEFQDFLSENAPVSNKNKFKAYGNQEESGFIKEKGGFKKSNVGGKLKDTKYSKKPGFHQSNVLMEMLMASIQKIIAKNKKEDGKLTKEELLKDLELSNRQQDFINYGDENSSGKSVAVPIPQNIKPHVNSYVPSGSSNVKGVIADSDDDDTDYPDFRIIGGAAATGSGSPISNRGRSGVTE